MQKVAHKDPILESDRGQTKMQREVYGWRVQVYSPSINGIKRMRMGAWFDRL
jgi:hypothetical protein